MESLPAAQNNTETIPLNTPRQSLVVVHEEEPRKTLAEIAPAPVNRLISFAINAPLANEIHVVGDFNQWKPNEESKLTRSEDGRWEKCLELSPGRHKYKFIVDGEWTIDSQNAEREANIFGTFDSVIKL